MRWDNLTLSDDSAQGALFGAGDVIARTFDTPEFRGMTFYEVRARSVLNKVPVGSRMPFGWTVNPYRGCGHACVSAVAQAGARSVTSIVLHLRPGAREWYLDWLQREHPALVLCYQELYGRGAYAPKAYQRSIAAQVAELSRRYGVGAPSPGETRRGLVRRTASRPGATSSAGSPKTAGSLTSPERAEQLTLL